MSVPGPRDRLWALYRAVQREFGMPLAVKGMIDPRLGASLAKMTDDDARALCERVVAFCRTAIVTLGDVAPQDGAAGGPGREDAHREDHAGAVAS